ncbi:MAG: hypothetical protein JO061_08885 [Acidobacteriaceae bacterium]|nr:hypothetical protein [Acidobacteriaceae bacterium]
MSARVLRLFGACLLLCAAGASSPHAAQDRARHLESQNQPPEQPPQPEQNPETPPKPEQPPDKPEFFAGIITTIDKVHVTVSRTLVGKAPETRTFLINPETKVSKAVKPRTKVTVRYRHSADGDIALEIQLRPQSRTVPKTS